MRQFDSAFSSRISVKLCYEPLSAAARAAIWSQIIQHSLGQDMLASVDCERLAAAPLNGREIKNQVKLAAAKAKGLGVTVDMKMLLDEIQILNEGQEAIIK